MAADTYHRRPLTVRARQWRGDNEDHVRELTSYFEAIDHPSEDPDATGQVCTDPHSTWELMYDGDWVVVMPGNIVVRMSDERFRTEYAETREAPRA
jgi:hypothetical protein